MKNPKIGDIVKYSAELSDVYDKENWTIIQIHKTGVDPAGTLELCGNATAMIIKKSRLDFSLVIPTNITQEKESKKMKNQPTQKQQLDFLRRTEKLTLCPNCGFHIMPRLVCCVCGLDTSTGIFDKGLIEYRRAHPVPEMQEESKKFTVLIDDNRNIFCDFIARNSHAGRFLLENLKGQIEELFLDYDLGSESDLTGLGILEWALKEDCLPNIIIICSGLPFGRKHMQDFLSAHEIGRAHV